MRILSHILSQLHNIKSNNSFSFLFNDSKKNQIIRQNFINELLYWSNSQKYIDYILEYKIYKALYDKALFNFRHVRYLQLKTTLASCFYNQNKPDFIFTSEDMIKSTTSFRIKDLDMSSSYTYNEVMRIRFNNEENLIKMYFSFLGDYKNETDEMFDVDWNEEMVKYEGLISKYKDKSKAKDDEDDEDKEKTEMNIEFLEMMKEVDQTFNPHSRFNNIIDYEYKTTTMVYDKIVYISLNENKINLDEKEKIEEKDGKSYIELTFKMEKIVKCDSCFQSTCSKCSVCLGKGTKTIADYQLKLNVLIEKIELLRSGGKNNEFCVVYEKAGHYLISNEDYSDVYLKIYRDV